MKKQKKDKNFIKKPIYEGGPAALKRFIQQNLSYPAEALEHQIEGHVYIKYDINYQGKVVDAKVITSLGHGCDEEALRLVKLLEFQVPKTRGVKVLFHKNIRIHFRLPKPESKSVQYQYAPAKKKEKSTAKKQGSYNYTINIGES